MALLAASHPGCCSGLTTIIIIGEPCVPLFMPIYMYYQLKHTANLYFEGRGSQPVNHHYFQSISLVKKQ